MYKLLQLFILLPLDKTIIFEYAHYDYIIPKINNTKKRKQMKKAHCYIVQKKHAPA